VKTKPRTKLTRESGDIDGPLIAWFKREARDLPWRPVDPKTGRRDPYRSLVSEVMLQQTQVARVVEKYEPFLRRFPTIAALAAAPLDDVLAEWSGLGYYRRARHLHACAKAVVERHVGVLPADVPSLLKLPGIGRYTAGAIASLVYHRPAPIVDGNVARVLLRVCGQAVDQQAGMVWSWAEAERLAAASKDIAAFNEGLMELGATVCTPANPRCDACPLARACVAKRENLQDQIPAPKFRAARSIIHFACVVVRDDRGRVLLEKRGSTGLWADMWQPPTVEVAGKRPTKSALERTLGAESLKYAERFLHQTTHRDVHFSVYTAAGVNLGERLWFTVQEAEALAMGNPQRRLLRSRD
jgi:A/G-specific adenine glycosylase